MIETLGTKYYGTEEKNFTHMIIEYNTDTQMIITTKYSTWNSLMNVIKKYSDFEEIKGSADFAEISDIIDKYKTAVQKSFAEFKKEAREVFGNRWEKKIEDDNCFRVIEERLAKKYKNIKIQLDIIERL